MKKILLLLFISITINKLTSQSLHKQFKDLPCVNKTINVHFHLVRDSLRKVTTTLQTLQSIISAANSAFAPICVSYSLCCIDTIDNYAFDSIIDDQHRQELIDKYANSNVLNVYLVNFIKTPSICGLSGINMLINKKCPGSFTHELGHTFGLPHTFEGGDELVNGSNSDKAGDAIIDTPADPYIPDSMIEYTRDCEFIYEGRDINREYYQPDVGNIMSYFGCDCGFTRDQYLIMANSILSNLNLW